MSKTAVVVIPTTGASSVTDAIQSVISQTYNVDCLVVIDGPEYVAPTYSNVPANVLNDPRVKIMQLPWNTGKPNWYGHRIYTAVSYILNQDYILYLDQDNWFEPTHVETMVNACETNQWHWCHSLRKIYTKDKEYICDDDCESLGRFPVFVANDQFLVDTSTYCIKHDVILNISPAWYSGWGGDRRFYSAISQHFPNFGCTKESTVCYRLDGNPGSVTAEFFIEGNKVMKNRFPGGYPWRK